MVEYRFFITLVDGEQYEMSPLYSNAATFNTERIKPHLFYRTTLNEKLTFVRDDFDLLIQQPFEHEYLIQIDRKVDFAAPWTIEYWSGFFYITDCTIDETNRILEVQPDPIDRYKKILDGIDREFNLISLAPETLSIDFLTKGVLQVYTPGSETLTNIIGGTHWEQPVTTIINRAPTGNPVNSELLDYTFRYGKTVIFLTGDGAAFGEYNINYEHINTNGRYILRRVGAPTTWPAGDPDGRATHRVQISAGTPFDNIDDFLSTWQSDDLEFEFLGVDNRGLTPWYYFRIIGGIGGEWIDTQIYHISGATNTDTKTISARQSSIGGDPWHRWGVYDTLNNAYIYLADYDENWNLDTLAAWNYQTEPLKNLNNPTDQTRLFIIDFYTRILTNETTPPAGFTLRPILDDDIAGSANYTHAIAYAHDGFIASSDAQQQPTEYGRVSDDAVNDAGQYFTRPILPAEFGSAAPLARSQWNELGIWFYRTALFTELETAGSKAFTLKDAYKLTSGIKRIVQALDPDLTHEETPDFSAFFYDPSNVIRGGFKVPLITPKSNVLVGDYDQAAQRAPVRLSDFLNFLKDFYQVYWDIDENGRFILEHIEFFEKGGSYDVEPTAIDLNEYLEPKNAHEWTYRNNKYSYEKSELPEQIKFKWMDDVSQPFEGFPIEILSKYVQTGNFEEKNFSLFTSDIDYINTNKDQISQEGFLFMEAIDDGQGGLIVPNADVQGGWFLQNPFASLVYAIPQYWRYQLPAPRVVINEQETEATSTRKSKLQNIDVPGNIELNPLNVIITEIGPGKIDKIEENLTDGSRKINLKHETERN